MLAWLRGDQVGNPSSIHAEGQRARAAVETARRQVARAIGANLADIVFTSGATEANNLALRSLGGRVATSAVEHPSILQSGADVVAIEVDPTGRLPEAERLVRKARELGADAISIMLANNETGNIYPIAAIAAAAKAAGMPVHCDATQGVGRIPVNAMELSVDMMSFSSHKIGGPKGIGALWVDPDTTLAPMVRGGHQERGRRGGTENVLAAVGFGAAAESLAEDDLERVRRLRDRLWDAVQEIEPRCVRNGAAPWLPNTLNVRFPDVDGEGLLMNLDLEGVAASAGSACSAGSLEPSHVILAMGVPEAEARGSVRFSLGTTTTEDDIDRAVASLASILPRLRAPGW